MQQDNLERAEFDWSRGRFPAWLKMIVCMIAVLLLMLAVFRVKHFEIIGNVHYSIEEIQEASGITDGDILMAVNKTRTAARLLTKLPYIERVTITKKLPNTIRIEIRECTADAVLPSGYSTYWLISADGKLLEELNTKEEAPTGCPLLNGADLITPITGDTAQFNDSTRADLLTKILAAVHSTGLADYIYEINVQDIDNAYLSYEDRLRIELGDGSKAEYKLLYFIAICKSLETNAAGVIDLSFTESLEEQAVYHPYE